MGPESSPPEVLLIESRLVPEDVAVIGTKREFDEQMRRDMERWRAEAAAADSRGFTQVATEIRRWIAAAESVVTT